MCCLFIRNALGSLALLVLCAGCLEQQKLPPLQDWITFQEPRQIYSILMPCSPIVKTKTVEEEEIMFYVSQAKKVDFAVTTCCHTLSVEEDAIDLSDREQMKIALDASIEGLKSLSNCNILEEHDGFADSSYPMREFLAKMTSGGKALLVRGRYIITPKAVIEVILAGEEEVMQQPQVLKCLNSVKIQK